MDFNQLKDTLARIAREQLANVSDWHESVPDQARTFGKSALDGLRALAEAEHLVNFRLWHVEDEARRTDVGPEVIAECKRRIDRLNQQRNDLIEQVDTLIVALVQPILPAGAAKRYNTETLGSALDRLSVLSLKIYHMREQCGRGEAGQKHVLLCSEKLRVLEEQHANLVKSVLVLVDEFARGDKTPKVYYQFKMYNDPALNPLLYGGKAGTSGD